MQKVILKLYIKGKLLPFFVCEITNDVEKEIEGLEEQLNNRNKDTVKFGSISFARDLFHHYTVHYK